MIRAASSLALLLAVLSACSAASDSDSDSADSDSADESVGRVSSAVTNAALVDVAAFGANPAALSMHKYVPAAIPAGARPLVVVLHGCTQTPATYVNAGWNSMADELGFFVLYPQQNTTKNNSSGCFNWGGRWKSAPSSFVFTPEALDLNEIARGNGENESIKEMVDQMKKDHTIDDKRVFITGLSSGGAMVSVMLATWPDVFAGGAIFAGIPYGCATDKKTTAEASGCTKDYSGENAYLARTPKAWGDLVRGAAPSFKGPYPRVQIWHGTSDIVVNQKNQAELVKQWTDVNGAPQTPAVTDQVETYPHEQYKDAKGNVVVETFAITGKSHGTEIAAQKPINPANAGGPKCGAAASYIIEAGICSTYYAAKFFALDAPPGSPAASSGGTSGPASSGGAASSSSSTSSSSSSGGASGDPAAKPGDGKWVEGDNGSTCSYSRSSSSPRNDHAMTFVGAAVAMLVLRTARRRRRS